MSTIAIHGWYMEYKDPANNSNKFYTVLIADNGVLVTHWGRIGSAGQHSIKKFPTWQDANVVGQRQVYAKQSKGYQPVASDLAFVMEEMDTLKAAEQDNIGPLSRAFHNARKQSAFTGDKDMVFKHYDEFVTKAQQLMDSMSVRPFDSVYAEFEELKSTWAEIDDKHAAASVTVSMIDGMLNQRLMSGI